MLRGLWLFVVGVVLAASGLLLPLVGSPGPRAWALLLLGAGFILTGGPSVFGGSGPAAADEPEGCFHADRRSAGLACLAAACSAVGLSLMGGTVDGSASALCYGLAALLLPAIGVFGWALRPGPAVEITSEHVFDRRWMRRPAPWTIVTGVVVTGEALRLTGPDIRRYGAWGLFPPMITAAGLRANLGAVSAAFRRHAPVDLRLDMADASGVGP